VLIFIARPLSITISQKIFLPQHFFALHFLPSIFRLNRK